MATAKDVADLAGVSQATVSYVMNGNRPISEETKQRVWAAMKRLSYHPNANARALAGRRTEMLAILARFDQNTELEELLPHVTAITSVARDYDYDTMLVPAGEGTAAMERLAGRAMVDAILMFDIEVGDARIATAAELNVPVVVIGNPQVETRIPAIDIDYSRAPTLVVEELLASGVRRIVAIDDLVPSERKFWFTEMFRTQVAGVAGSHDVELKFLRSDELTGPAMSPFLDMLRGWTRNDRYGIAVRRPREVERVMQLLLYAGLEPGRDVAVVAICEDDVAESAVFPLTNVSPRGADVAAEATRVAIKLIAGEGVATGQRLLEPRLTRRMTTRPAAQLPR